MGWPARPSTGGTESPLLPSHACVAAAGEEGTGGLAALRMPAVAPVVQPARATKRMRSFYATVRPQVARIASALIGEKPPGDLVHDICVEVTLSQARFRRDCAFSTWMYAIVGHHVHNWIRQERNRRDLMRAIEQAPPAAPGLRPDETLDMFVVVDLLESGFATLTEAQRACLILMRWECLSSREVASRLHLTPTAVRMHVHRARAHLRKCLDDG